jgi:hypothetical protein
MMRRNASEKGTNVEELKACPFCGRDPTISPPLQIAPEITCDRCLLVMGDTYRKDLIARWNRRIFRVARARGAIPGVFREGR